MNCIFTASFGNDFGLLNNITHEYMRKYAEKINTDFIVVKDNTPVRCKHDAVKLMLKCKWKVKELFEKYDRVLYIDSDVLVLPTAKNVFDVVPKKCISLFEEGYKYPNNLNFYSKFMFEYNKKLKEKNIVLETKTTTSKYYNAGIFLADSSTKDIFVDPIVELPEIHPDLAEQNYFNLILQKNCNNITIFDLPIEFNRMVVWRDSTMDTLMKSSFIHYSITPNPRRLALIKIHLSEHKRKFRY